MSLVVPRSAGVLEKRRALSAWPPDRDFRILSIDGGGIRGVFPAALLAALEERYLNGSSVSRYFDLITGTSTGGVIAIGLGAGLRASELRDLYIERGGEIFPPARAGFRWIRKASRCFRYSYKREALDAVLSDLLGGTKLGESQNRLCIPSCDGEYTDPYVFKTPHHPDFRLDGAEPMTKVAAATTAAPTYFRPLEAGGYTFLDGGLWANNPVMVGLVDALSCFAVRRERIRILSIGCGDAPYTVSKWQRRLGGSLAWHNIIYAAMHFQSLSALGQAGLLIGKNRITRVAPQVHGTPIALDDWEKAITELPPAALASLDKHGNNVVDYFLSEVAIPYTPLHGFRRTVRTTNPKALV